MIFKFATATILLVLFRLFSALPTSAQVGAAPGSVQAEGAPDEAPAYRLMHEAQRAVQVERRVEAERLFQLAIEEAEKMPAPSSTLADVLVSTAGMYARNDQVSKAVSLTERALDVDEKAFGPLHQKVARDLIFLARFYLQQKKPAEAGEYMKRAAEIEEALARDSQLRPHRIAE
jgi:tetratricopeptide (TPR) repeat protein